jgi:hypothetical protein
MAQSEMEARRLAALLTEHGIAARVEGSGVHWHVDVGPVNGRSVRVNCFWYERGIAALMLGMNAANARSSLRKVLAPYQGPEFLVTINDGHTCH